MARKPGLITSAMKVILVWSVKMARKPGLITSAMKVILVWEVTNDQNGKEARVNNRKGNPTGCTEEDLTTRSRGTKVSAGAMKVILLCEVTNCENGKDARPNIREKLKEIQQNALRKLDRLTAKSRRTKVTARSMKVLSHIAM